MHCPGSVIDSVPATTPQNTTIKSLDHAPPVLLLYHYHVVVCHHDTQ